MKRPLTKNEQIFLGCMAVIIGILVYLGIQWWIQMAHDFDQIK